MPTIKELEEFTQYFRTLGNEVVLSVGRGEPYNDLPLPDTEPVGNLFADAKAPSESGGTPAENSQNDTDWGAFLDSIPDDLQENSVPNKEVDYNDGLGDLLSGFAEDIEAERFHPEDTADFSSPNPEDSDFGNFGDFNFSDESANIDSMKLDDFNPPEDFSENIDFENSAGDAVDADFEELGDSGTSENPSNLDSIDFGDLDNFTFPEETASTTDFGDLDDVMNPEDSHISDEDSVISNDEMLSLFSEDPVHSPKQDVPDDIPDITDLPNIEDAPNFEDIGLSNDTPADEDFSFDAGSDAGLEMPADSIDDIGSAFDVSVPDMDEDFSIPEMDDSASFDTVNLLGETADLGGETVDVSEPADSDANIEELDSFDNFDLDEEQNASSDFNLPESDFNIDDVAFNETSSLDDDINFALSGIEDTKHAEASPDVEEIHLSDEELSSLEKTLNSFPLNLRIACEELIAEHAVTPELMSDLVKKLVNGASPKETANLAGKILGKTIPVPKGFLKKTGKELEAEQSSFGYIFVHSFLPVLRTFAIAAALLFSLGYLMYQFIYIPIHADGIYKRGYELIGNGEYARANDDFIDALKIQQMKKWFFRYAEAFRTNRQYVFAEEKYDELLRYYPRDKQGALDYARLETYYLYNYEKANRILRNNILDYSIDDRDGLFAQGENFLAWGEIDPSQLENARAAFARLMERYGESDLYLEQMLKYFIRTNNLAQVLPLQTYFLASSKTKITAPSLAELGGYLLDKRFEQTEGVPDENIDNIEGIREVLFRAVQEDSALPESHYHLARYYSRFGSVQEEQTVLGNAMKAFDAAPELSAKRIGYRIDTQRRAAWILTTTKYFVNAEETLIKGINLYEDALTRRVLPPTPNFGRLYADLADIELYKNGDFDSALQNYLHAEENGWHPPEVIYRMGAIYYHSDNMAEAIGRFFEVSNETPLNKRLLYTLGNASYSRGDYFAAEGYYNRLLDILETEKVRAATLLPHDRPEHMELAERIMEAQNNLGVTLGTLADRTGNVNYRTRALSLFAESARAWDFITRNPVSWVRLFVPGTEIPETNQPLLNTKYTLYPEPGYEPLIYNLIDMDMQEPSTWEYLVPPDNRARDIPYEIRNQE